MVGNRTLVEQEQREAEEVRADISSRNKIIKFIIDENTIKQFIFTENRRKIRNGVVEDISYSLNRGQCFDEPIHVNFREEQYRIVDGNHRMTAVTKYLDNNPQDSIEINLAIYNGLTDEEERRLFDVLSSVAKQTMNDFVKIHFDEVEIFHMINDDFPIPIKIYATTANLSYANLMNVWFCKEGMYWNYQSKRNNFLDDCKRMKRADHHDMVKFFDVLIKYFGKPEMVNPYYKPIPLWIITSLYFRNSGVIDQEELWKRLKEKVFADFKIIEHATSRNREVGMELRKYLVDKMNKGWRHTKFV